VSDTLVKVEGVSKKFSLSLKRSLWYGMKDLGNELLGRRHGGNGQLRKGEFWAVQGISFELRRGECLGLVGHNGAGKTTLLRMLNGLIKPDQGRIEIRGKVGALIALGAGFNPILTGRENIYTNASVLGLSRREVDAKLDEIIDFAEIGRFIDAPIQNYSTGMHLRLGFSVAALLIEPDVLFLDEVLAVGDIGFIIKCLNKVRKLTANSAVVFVSHSMPYISAFCTRVIVMKNGEALLNTTKVGEGVDCYLALAKHATETSGTGEGRVLNLDLLVDGELQTGEEPLVQRGSSATAVLRLQIDGPRAGAIPNIAIHDETMMALVHIPLLDADSRVLLLPPGEHVLEIPLGSIELNTGKYSFVAGILDPNGQVVLGRVQGLRPFRVSSKYAAFGKVVRPAVAQLKPLPRSASTLQR
jgi:homopolymeric O-antigen transport system ATP-binding protein